MNVLLLRGLVREQRHWGDFPARLRGRDGVGRVACLDLPGTGTEHARPAPSSADATIDDVRGRFRELRDGIPGPWAVVGISLGGLLALGWCARHAADFSRAVAINSSAGQLSPFWERLRWRNYGRLAVTLASDDLERREAEIIRMTINRRDFDAAALARRFAEHARESPASRRTFVRQLRVAADARVTRLGIPTLVVTSRGDRFVSSRCSEALARFLGAPLAVHPDAGHDLPFDAGDWLAAEISGWLARSQLEASALPVSRVT